ncbi:ICP22 family protein [Wenjunlia vitaminophila]|uniref:hypothetical protein n=1 Tax=Wenjunlia vitaminophila TaxID=76728 RepID=UPI000ADCC3C0|nr:hypothetical protein [Wenjunlia vitaminophila]
MAGASGGDSHGKLWIWLGGIASVIAILGWFGVSNPQELEALLDDSSPSVSAPAPHESYEAPHGSDEPETEEADTGGPGSGVDRGDRREESPDSGPSPTPEDPAEEDPAEVAFKAVSVGDCLGVYDTGSGGTRIEWSADVPPSPVPCDSGEGLLRVTSTADDTCPSGPGKASWAYTSAVSGETTTLCVTRVYRKYYCMLGEQVGDTTRLGSMTAVDCEARQVPAPYNRIVHILGVYQAPPGANAGNCVEGAYDQRQYLAWLVDDGRTLLCATFFQGG